METEHYTIRHSKGKEAELRCSHCDYRIRTRDFDRSNGNVRTQAAKVMIAHHEAAHRRSAPVATASHSGMERLWLR